MVFSYIAKWVGSANPDDSTKSDGIAAWNTSFYQSSLYSKFESQKSMNLYLLLFKISSACKKKLNIADVLRTVLENATKTRNAAVLMYIEYMNSSTVSATQRIYAKNEMKVRITWKKERQCWWTWSRHESLWHGIKCKIAKFFLIVWKRIIFLRSLFSSPMFFTWTHHLIHYRIRTLSAIFIAKKSIYIDSEREYYTARKDLFIRNHYNIPIVIYAFTNNNMHI